MCMPFCVNFFMLLMRHVPHKYPAPLKLSEENDRMSDAE